MSARAMLLRAAASVHGRFENPMDWEAEAADSWISWDGPAIHRDRRGNLAVGSIVRQPGAITVGDELRLGDSLG